MAFNKFIKMATVTGLMALVACSPASKEQQLIDQLKDGSSIIGGVPVEMPDTIAKSTIALVATVKTTDGKDGQFICTGSLLTEDTVLTAAHCIPQVGKDFKQVALYVIFNSEIRAMKKEDIRLVVDAEIHEGYGTSTNGEDDHDIAVVRFAGPVASGYHLAKFLKDEALLTEGTKVTLAGYGLIKTDGVTTESDDRLRKVQVEIAGNFGKHEVLLDQTQGKGACHGDSGGPAFLDVNGEQLVWGITSRGAGKDGKDDCSLVAVYTKVMSESAFVTKALEKLNGKK